MGRKKKKYIPDNKFNPAALSRKLDMHGETIEKLGKTIEAISSSHDNHISHLGNFARHDIKNAILSMDSILTVTTLDEINNESIESLKTYLNVIKDTMENFAKLIPYSSEGAFKLESLLVAIELLSRADMQKHSIQFELDFPRVTEVNLNFPFQAILQMVNNLIINSIKSLEECEEKKIKLMAKLEHDKVSIKLSDSGHEIEAKNMDKIFKYGFTTTGGSGIGLYHAKYLCDQFNGGIELENAPEIGFTKTFCITLPV